MRSIGVGLGVKGDGFPQTFRIAVAFGPKCQEQPRGARSVVFGGVPPTSVHCVRVKGSNAKLSPCCLSKKSTTNYRRSPEPLSVNEPGAPLFMGAAGPFGSILANIPDSLRSIPAFLGRGQRRGRSILRQGNLRRRNLTAIVGQNQGPNGPGLVVYVTSQLSCTEPNK